MDALLGYKSNKSVSVHHVSLIHHTTYSHSSKNIVRIMLRGVITALTKIIRWVIVERLI